MHDDLQACIDHAAIFAWSDRTAYLDLPFPAGTVCSNNQIHTQGEFS
jgi:hypothetical protein